MEQRICPKCNEPVYSADSSQDWECPHCGGMIKRLIGQALAILFMATSIMLYAPAEAYAPAPAPEPLYETNETQASMPEPHQSIHVAQTPSRGQPTPKIEQRTMTVTAYTAGYESTGKRPGDPWYGITASGKRVEEGHTIAAPPDIPFGTQIYIPELGRTYTVADRGGAIKGDKLDIYIEDLDRALQFGVKKLEVYIKYP